MRFWLLSLTVLLLLSTPLSGQVGGLFTYDFLSLPASARISALGATHIAVVDDDVNLAGANPALLNPAMHQQLTFSHAFHPAGIQHGYVAGGWYRESWQTTFHGSLRYADYGTFDLTNTTGQVEGEFKAAEYGITVGAARPVYERLTAGVNLRFVTSRLESYRSLGVAADLALLYQDTARDFTLTFVAKHMGRQLKTYREGDQEPLPFEMQVGLAKKLRYLPFRFSIIYRYFDRWNILYDDPNQTEDNIFLGDVATERSASSIWFDNFFRHFVFNGELLLGRNENFRLRFGYSHLLRKEMALGEFRSLAGFTFGAGVKINRFRLDYGRTNLHLGSGVNHLSISTNLREFR
ncbi:MAG: type IX secretion system protein PorQ [Lewinella sp.]|nr:type IX secretion system protein PorQ [Lewinella sp.]